MWDILLRLWDSILAMNAEAKIGLSLLFIALLTLHRDSNTKKLEFFWEIWGDICNRLDVFKQDGGQYERERLINSIEFLALNYNRNLVHRKICKEYLTAVLNHLLMNEKLGLKKMLCQAKSPILLEIKLMRASLNNKSWGSKFVEIVMPLPVVSAIFLWFYNKILLVRIQTEKEVAR